MEKDSSVMIDMDEMDASGFDFQEFHGSQDMAQQGASTQGQDPQQQGKDVGLFGTAQETINSTVTNMMWQAGRSQATKAWSIFGNIDVLRPYFDVEPKDVMKRIINSMVPKPPSSASPTKVVSELYGPTMLVLTLIALLLFEMKSSDHTVQEGTLIGTAFGTCFGYWIGCGTIVWLVAYVCNTHLAFLQLLSMLGYSLSSHCIVVLLSTLIHTAHDHMFFYLLWGIFGGLSTLRMASILFSRTHGPSQKLIITGVTAFFSLTFLLYLHFAYHKIVEEVDDIFNNDNQDAFVPGRQEDELKLDETANLKNS